MIFVKDYLMKTPTINSVNCPRVDISKFGLIINGCSRLLSHTPNFKVSFISRQGKGVAFFLARIALSKSTPPPPQFLSLCSSLHCSFNF